MIEYAILLAGAAAAAILTSHVRRRALSRGLLDHPNSRSSHSVPVPRGGGSSIVAVVTVVTAILAFLGQVPAKSALAIVLGGLAIACVGHIDDRRSVPVLSRLAVHFGAAAFAVWMVGGLPPIQWGNEAADLGLAGDVLAVLAVVWGVNLFNFMDGIDGLAASEAVVVTGAAAGLALLHGGSGGWPLAALAVAFASAGFLPWNWPPARIFMGDVGSGYLGYVIVVLALTAGADHAAAVWVWLILGGVFFVDATLTLLRRLARRERVYEAHRIHGYQWLARSTGSHLAATSILMIVNAVWLLPLAWCAYLYPAKAHWITLLALSPVALGLLAVGAGRPEMPAADEAPDDRKACSDRPG